MPETTFRIFVSSPGDVDDERRRVDLVVERLNTEFRGRVRIETIRWETSFYSAHDTFQKQIPEAADCDVVVALFRARLGTPLPASFPAAPTGEAYPSGSAYEVLSAIAARKGGKGLPDIYVFRYPKAPAVALDAQDRAQIEAQWEQLKHFFATWFRTKDGEFLAAFQNYDSTDDFAQKVEDCLRQWLARRGFAAQGPVWDRARLGSPFPGLAAFEADRRSMFFGRDLAIAQAIDRLRDAGATADRAPFLLLIGASGSGKSSLVRAGLLPRLTLPGMIPEIDLWRTALIVPGPDPFLSLADELLADAALGHELRQGIFGTPELLAKQLAGDTLLALAPIRDALEKAAQSRKREASFDTPRPARLALAIDQAERLFTEAAPATASAFADLLAALVGQHLAYVILVLRSDAYAQLQSSAALVRLREAGATFDLVPPSPGEIEEIVTRPVAACQPTLAFEQKDGRSLAAHLVADAKGGDALPLLQIALARLDAAEADRGDGVLRFADYQGMDAAVTATANEALDTLHADARAELPALVSALVTDVAVDPLTGASVPVVTALDRTTFEAGRPSRRALVDAFVGQRLLTAEGDDISHRVRPVHEALLRIWPQAVAIISETASLIRVRHTLVPLVREWEGAPDAEQAGHLDISPALLDGAQQLVARMGEDLPARMHAFIAGATGADAARRAREGQEQERRIRDAEALVTANRRIARRTLIGLVAALILAALAGWQWRYAEQAQKEATTQRDRARHSLAVATDTANALVFDLARKFRGVVGVPTAMIKDILDRARKLQDQLLGSGETSPRLRRSQADALGETAETLLTLGQTADALASAQQEREIFQTLLKGQPASTDLQRELSVSDLRVGDVQVAQGHLPEALTSYQASLTIMERLAASNSANLVWQRDLSVSHEKIGDVQVAQGHLPEALASYQADLAIVERLASSDHGNTSLQRDLSVSYDRIGDVEVAQGHLPEALAAYQADLAIADRLASSNRGNADWQRDLAVSDNKVGDVKAAQGQKPEALAAYSASLAITEKLAASDPGNTQWQRDLSVTDEKIGDVKVAQGQFTEALTSYQASLTIMERLGSSDRGNADWQHDLVASHERMGKVETAQGQGAEAIKSYQTALTIMQRLAASDPGNAGWQYDVSAVYADLGRAFSSAGQATEASEALVAGRAVIAPLVAQHPDEASWKAQLAWFDKMIAASKK